MEMNLQSFIGGFDLLMSVLTWIIILAVVGVIAFWFWQMSQYKTRVIIKDVVKNRIIVIPDKARRVKDKNGNMWWKLLKCKDKIPEPSPEAIEIDIKGKKWCEFFRLEGVGYFPSKSKKGYLSIGGKIDEKLFKDLFVSGSEPFTTQQRALYINELREAEEYKRISKHDLIARAIPYVALVLILSVFMLFFSEAVQPMVSVGDKYVSATEKLDQAFEKLDSAINNRQYITGEEDVNQGIGGVPE